MAATFTLGPITAVVVDGKPPRKYAVSVVCPVVQDDGRPVRSKTMNARLEYPAGPRQRSKTATMNIRDGFATCEFPMASTDPAGSYRVVCNKTGAQTVSAMVEVPGQ